MTANKPDPDGDHQLGAEIAASLRAHEQPGSVDDIIESVRAEYGAGSRMPSRDRRKRRPVALLAAASVVVMAGVTGLIAAETSSNRSTTPAGPPTDSSYVSPAKSALTDQIVRPGDQVVAEGRGGIATAGADGFELCSTFIGPADLESPGPENSTDRPGFGCGALGAIKIATLRPSGALDLADYLDRPVQISGTYNADASITADSVAPASIVSGGDPYATMTPCPAPTGGWKIRAGNTSALNQYLAREPGEYLITRSRPEGQSNNVVTVGTLTKDLTTTRDELETIYGQQICVYRATHSQKQLDEAASGASAVLRNSGSTLWSQPHSVTSPTLPLAPGSDTAIGYVLAVTPELAQQLQPFSEYIQFVPFISPQPATGSSLPVASSATSAPASATPVTRAPCGAATRGLRTLADLGLRTEFGMSGTTSNPTYYVTVSKEAASDATIRIDRMGELVAFDTADPTSTLTGRSGFLGYRPIPDSVELSPDNPSGTAQVDYLHVIRDCATSDLEPDGTSVWAAVLVKVSIDGGPPELFVTTPQEVRVTDNLVRLSSPTGASASATPQPTPTSQTSAPTTTSTTRTTAAGSTLPLPTFVRASHEYIPQALAQGVLTRDRDGCVRIGPAGPVAVWPSGYTASADPSGTVRIIAPSGEVARTGDRVAATGGDFQAETPGCSTAAGSFNVFLLEIR